MRLVPLVSLAFLSLFAIQSADAADDAETEKLKQQIEILELKFQLAEQSAEQLEKECAELRKENAKLKGAAPKDTPAKAEEEDQFRVGRVWVGVSKDTRDPKKTNRWAISIAERDGTKMSGGLAIVTADGKKVDVPFTGTAPTSGDGLVVIESPLIGRAKIYARGRLTNGQASLAFSGTNPLGDKVFGAAAMKPE
jgi:hypothetical protein